MTKTIAVLKETLTFARCAHEFDHVKDHAVGGGVVGWCPTCRCRVTSWPGTENYDLIVAARERKRDGRVR